MASIASVIKASGSFSAAVSQVSSLTAPRTELSQTTTNRFEELPAELYGRTKEVEALRHIYREQQEHVVFVEGKAGVGKSTLVNTALREHVLDCGGYFTVGKFEQLGCSKDPYGALVAAFTDLCDLILVSDDRQRVKERINAELGEEARVLGKLIYNLADITEMKTMESESDENFGSMFLRFKLLCKSFLSAVASEAHPVVILLDDLQWMDEASTEVIKMLVNDKNENSHVLIVCAYRHDEFDPKILDQPSNTTATTMTIDTLCSDDLNSFIADLMQLEPSLTEELAAVVSRKTNGNPFSVRQFLDLLRVQGMLFQSSGRWEWVLERIQADTNVDDSVLALVSQRVGHLHEHVQTALKLASFLGHRFDVQPLWSVVITEYNLADDEDQPELHEIISLLDQAVKENMLERINDDTYQFSHDQIQQCLYHSIEDVEDREAIHLRIGYTLLQFIKNSDSAKNLLIMAADHLNRGSPQVVETAKASLADINFEAGKRATAQSAFYPAAGFFLHGIKFLEGTDAWTNQYDLALELHSSASEMCYTTGDLASSAKAAAEVLKEAKCGRDKLRAQLIVIDTLALQRDLTNAIRIGFDLLAQFGVRFPKKVNKGHVIREAFKTKRFMRGKTDEHFLSLPECTDPEKNAMFKLMSHLSTLIFWAGDENLLILFNMKLCQLSCYEVSAYACEGFCMYGGVLGFFGDYIGAHRFGILGIRLLEKLNAKSMEGRVRNTSGVACLHWIMPYGDVSRCLMKSYTSGRRSGDVEIAFLGAIGAVCSAYHAGAPLEEIDERCTAFAAEMKEFGGQTESLRIFSPFWQKVKNLRGTSSDPTRMVGDAMDNVGDPEKGTASSMACFYLESMQLAVHFERHKDMKALLPYLLHKHPPNPVQHLTYQGDAYAALAYFELHRIQKKRNYRRKARGHLHKLKRYVDKGAVAVKVLHMFVQAEETRISAKKDIAVAAFKSVVDEAKEQNSTEIACLCAERGVIAMIDMGYVEEAKLFLNSAIDGYEEWGAPAKVEFLMTKYDELVDEYR